MLCHVQLLLALLLVLIKRTHGLSTFPSVVKSIDNRLGQLYKSTVKIKCPFFRRRSYDLLDSATSVFEFFLARHKSLNLPGLQQLQLGCQDGFTATAEPKTTGLPLAELKALIEDDWKAETAKGYYISGKLNRAIYSDDCLFDGPDPDMPVKGLKKYLSSASQIFEFRSSRADLLRLEVVDVTDPLHSIIKAHWRIEGKLNLPWHPPVKPWTGSTTYYISPVGLVERHIETWDISVADAFLSTLFPTLGSKLGAMPAP